MKHPMLNMAVKAARRAATLIQRSVHNLSAIRFERKSYNDFVSEVDRAAEEVIVQVLHEAYPDHNILTEEGGAVFNQGSPYQWVIDPLDGTTNFLHGHLQYAVSIALLVQGTPTVGVVFDPNRNDLYTAVKGSGAALNDRRMRVSQRSQLADALIGTGFPVTDFSVLDRYMVLFKHLLPKTSGLRREGAASLDLCAVAAGRLDGFWEFNLKPWDMAAGALMIQESGGLVTDFSGEASWFETGHIVAGNPKILSALLTCFREADFMLKNHKSH
jgi:myo-inositol-1(or 4)-monophosphatase